MTIIKSQLLLLTELNNAQDGEDRILAGHLSDLFDVRFADLDNVLNLSANADGILIRNNWPVFGDEVRFWDSWPKVRDGLKATGIPCYNSLDAHGDMQGKAYLAELFEESFPVIPTTLDFDGLDKLPVQERYVVKPWYGGDSYGLEIVEKSALSQKELYGYVIQPFVDIRQEIHMVFVDNQFIYAFSAKDRREDPMPDDIGYYAPAQEELDLARRFVEWNALPTGLQRVDIVRLADGRLLLNELEDHAPYLWLAAMPQEVQDRFLDVFHQSLRKWMPI